MFRSLPTKCRIFLSVEAQITDREKMFHTWLSALTPAFLSLSKQSKVLFLPHVLPSWLLCVTGHAHVQSAGSL